MVARPRNQIAVSIPGGGVGNPAGLDNQAFDAPSSSGSGITMEKMESGELPPSPFAGKKSWDIDFEGFGSSGRDGDMKKLVEKQAQEETAIDSIIWVLYRGYRFFVPKIWTWKKLFAHICLLTLLLLIIYWMSGGFQFLRE